MLCLGMSQSSWSFSFHLWSQKASRGMFIDPETALPIHRMQDCLVYTIPFHHVTMSKVNMKTVQTVKQVLCLDRNALCVAPCILVSSQFQKGSYLMHAGALLWNTASRKSCEGSSERSTEESGSKTIVLRSSNEKRKRWDYHLTIVTFQF